jgi:hypothetical protein
VTHQANFKTIARVAVGGGIVAAGACALIGAAPAQAQKGIHTNTTTNTTTTTTQPNGNPTTPPVLTGFSGFVPTWQKGTYNTATCPGGTCFVPQSTSPFPTGTTPTATNPIVANPSGTNLQIGLAFI